ncbi:hypothetical protein [Frankia sp. CiP3]|uniref:hypothetical protein n=1 Tax=Frankia sp. CiP3 TaxID=2880971 RepID=UPI001EF3F71D|nr:hypothetical protein [Frankia sp. CiP3]
MTVLPLPVREIDARAGRDRLEILTALIAAPSFDPLFRAELIRIPAGHRIYRWQCAVDGCDRPATGQSSDLCTVHAEMWRQYQREDGATRASFLIAAAPLAPSAAAEELPCRICPQRPAAHVTLRLCRHHKSRWSHCRDHDGTDFGTWLAEQIPMAGYGDCQVRVCPEMADTPLGLCARHGQSYRQADRPGGAALPRDWANRYESRGLPVPISHAGEAAFTRWCASAAVVPRPGQVNLRGVHPLVRAEIQWGMFTNSRRPQSQREPVVAWQGVASFARAHGLRTLRACLTTLDDLHCDHLYERIATRCPFPLGAATQ